MMRKVLAILAFLVVAVLGGAETNPARAAGNWTDFSLPEQSPWCGGGGCPDLASSCMSAAYSWWPSDPAAHLRSCEPTSEAGGHAYVDALCCGQLYNAWPNLNCPPGQIPDASVPSGCRIPDNSPCPDCTGSGGGEPSPAPVEGNPMVVSGGSKFDSFVDYSTAGPNALSFVRTYNSHSRATLGLRNLPLGHKWISNFDIFMWSASSSNYNTMYAMRPSGDVVTFTLSGSVYVGASDRPQKLVKTATTFELTDTNDRLETYDLTGKLLSIKLRNGYTQTLAYDTNGKLQSVTDSYGRALTFQFTGDRLTRMFVPGGTFYSYQYDKSIGLGDLTQPDRLIGVTSPKTAATDSATAPQVTYHYENATYPLWLTGITDEKGIRFATWGYDAQGRAILSKHAGDIDQTTLTFNANGTVTATRPLGKQIIYSFSTIAGRPKVTSIAQQASTNTPAATETRSYDGNGFLSSRTDFRGNVTNYVYNTQGLQTTRAEAFGTPQARTITTTWHATFRVPTQIVEPGKTTDFTHDTSGRVLTKTETDTRTQTVPYSTNGQTRTWTYTWDATGLLQTVNGPRTDVADTTTYAWTNGVLSSVTNAASQITTVNTVNERGLPTKITDPNGVVTDLAYNQRGWLTSVTKRSANGDAVTGFEYDQIGQITAIVQPDGIRLQYEYDNARRLTAVANSLGERIEYTLDAMGNRTAEKIKSGGGTIVKSMTHTYDELGRLLRNIGAGNQTTIYAYDKNDNVTAITDPLNGATAQAYDALDRLISSTDPATKVTAYGYDNQDNLTSITDARNVQTTYVYDGFGRVIQTASPDGGTTVYVYDKADNLTQKTDGRAVVTNYTYDALNRVTAKTFPAATAENVTYAYDNTTPGRNGIGRLASITDQSGSTAFEYDTRGNVTKETRVISGVSYVTTYAYDVADRLTQMIYPSGRIVSYARDTLGRVTSVTTQASASAPPAAIASNITYKPFGPIASMSYGNGLNRTYSYDSDYRLTGLTTNDPDTNVQNLSYGYDAADNILSIGDALAAGRSQTFTYDSLFRLKTAAATGTYGSITYNYDAVGNRTSVVDGAGTESYTTDASSNRLQSVTTGGVVRSFSYDGAGNITADAVTGTSYGLTYNKANRLAQVSLNGTATHDYLYNALGERVKKTPVGSPTTATHFHYDRDGKLIAETNPTGAVVREYAWLGSLPIGEFTNASGGTPPAQVQIDNNGAGATFTGSWSAATAGSGYIGTNYHKYEPLVGGVPPGGTTVDNTDAGFSTFGLWGSATTPAGFVGSNFVTRAYGDADGTETILDNTDAGFSVTGTWTASTQRANYYGTNYVEHPTNQPSPEAVIVDNGTAGASIVGTWSTSINGAKYGANYRYKAAGTGTASHTWTPTLPANQQYNVYAWWVSGTDRATNAPYTIHHAGGSTLVSVNQQSNGGKWNLLGSFTMAPGQNHRVVLTDNANGVVSADAVQVVRVGALPPTATWTPVLPRADRYEVYERTPVWGTWTSDATYKVIHAAGTTSSTKTQVTGGGTWKLLATVDLYPGQGHRVELPDTTTTGGTIVADAVKFTPVASAKSATWTISVGTTGSYKVYARWPASATYAVDAQYTVSHAGGNTTVTANQRLNGGQWNLLGTFSFNAGGSGYKVTLADNTLARVAADAIYYVRDTAPTDAFTWTPTFPSAGTYAVFARWPASSGNTGAATYTVTRAGGTSTVVANQKQNGGSWVPLGSYSFTPGAGHKVTLTGSSDGTTIADALLFVASGSQPANLLYAHADHLGSPQKLTDAAQATVWDGVFDPFGKDVSIGGLAAMPLRFPGQYADDETGYSYNYFRDYEPTLGRYLQSDPIGLAGGINPYSYVSANPLIGLDTTGTNMTAVVLEGLAADVAIPEPSDAAWPKWLGWGIAIGGAVVLDLCLSSSDEEEQAKRCEENLERDLATCHALGRRNGKKAFRICEKQAMLRYSNCLSGRDEGIKAPLPQW